MTWAATVSTLRVRAESERWRLAAVRGVRGWREFVVAWPQVSASVPDTVKSLRPPAYKDFDALLAWVWEAAEDWADAALAAVDARLPFGTFQTFGVYTSLRGAGLIYPDGSVIKPLLDRVDRSESLRDLMDAAAHQSKAEELNESIRRVREAAKVRDKEPVA